MFFAFSFIILYYKTQFVVIATTYAAQLHCQHTPTPHKQQRQNPNTPEYNSDYHNINGFMALFESNFSVTKLIYLPAIISTDHEKSKRSRQ